MAEYEPDDSRDVTHSNATAPGEPPRTGPREDARAQAEQRNGSTQQGGQTDGQADSEAPGDQAIEGDSPNHPDRMGAFTGETAQGTEDSDTRPQGDRWHEKAEQAPDGK